MAKNGFKVIDAEPHMMEPLEIWIERLPEPFRSRTHVVRPDNGGFLEGSSGRIVLDGVETPKSTPNPMVRRRSQRRVTANPGLMKVTKDPSPDVFLEGFDIEGIDVGVFMPTVAMGMVRYDGLDPEHALALCRVYNDFTSEFCSAHPDRFKFWAWVPPHDAKLAAGEAQRAVEELGAVAVAMTGGAVNGNLLSDEHFDPLWQEMDRLGTAFGMHGPPANYLLRDNYNHRYWGKRNMEIVGNAMVGPVHAMTQLAELTIGGVLERFPNLKPVFMEVNASWLPWFLWRLDDKWETHAPDMDYELSKLPSEYFQEQGYCVVEPEEGPIKFAIDFMGADRLLFSTDYPHSDCIFPEAVNTFLAQEHIPDEAKRKILWDNASKLFGVEAPVEAPAGG
ncbi:MAG: amidohydrolase family protein [Chloroflexota bacterium]|nr:amidohydrolase family protein [Chloroflexota bacterium]